MACLECKYEQFHEELKMLESVGGGKPPLKHLSPISSLHAVNVVSVSLISSSSPSGKYTQEGNEGYI